MGSHTKNTEINRYPITQQIYIAKKEQNADLCEDPHWENYHPRG